MKRKPIPIEHLDDAQYDALLRLAGEPAALSALAGIEQALEQERGANLVGTRRNAQRQAMGHRIALENALGLIDLRRRRLYAAAKGEPEGTPSDVFALDAMLAGHMGSSTPTTRQRERKIREQLLGDELEALKAPGVRSLLWREFAHMRGYEWPADDYADPIGGIVNTRSLSLAAIDALADRREKHMGVRQTDLPRLILRVMVMQFAGDEAGKRYGGADKLIPLKFWAEMSSVASRFAAADNLRARSGELLEWKAAAIKSTALRTGTDEHEIFSRARQAACGG